MSVRVAEELTGRARRFGLNGEVQWRPTNGIGWRYQWCTPNAEETLGLGDTRADARSKLQAIADDLTPKGR